jgi:hypothetical protein
LNGTKRNAGWVGQTSLSRSLPQSLMKGNTLRGHGGCCGTYPIKPNITSAILNYNDSTVIKPSTLNTNGMIMTKYRWLRRTQPHISVKNNSWLNSGNQEQYIQHVKEKELANCKECDKSNYVNGHYIKKSKNFYPRDTNIFKNQNYNTMYAGRYNSCDVAKDVGAINQSLFIDNLQKSCSINDTFYYINNTNNTPMIGGR